MDAIEGWSPEECEEFLKTFQKEIRKAASFLEDWLDAEV